MSTTETHANAQPRGTVNPGVVAVAWLWVIIPFGYGLYELIIKIPALFGS